MKYSVVIPAYNEEDNISLLAAKIKEVMNTISNDWELIFIDDGSKDKTLQKMQEERVKDERIKIISFRRNFGQSVGWQAGFDYASGDIVITMDADMQNDPADIPAMLKMVETGGYDVVSGWRSMRQDSFYIKFLSKVGNYLRRVVTGDKTHDHGCSLKVYRKECLESIDFYSDLHRRYIAALLAWRGFKVGEMRTTHHARKYGKSKYSVRKKWKGLLDLLVVKFWMQYSTRPIHLFGSLGLAISGTGFLLGGTLGVLWLFRMISLQNRTTPLLAVLLVIIGLQLVMTGFIADTVAMTYYSTKRAYTIELQEGFENKG